VRVLRADPHAFTSVLFFLLCPASGCLLLSAAALEGAAVLPLARRLLAAAAASGLPLTHFVRQLAHHLAATLVASVVSFPATFTLLLAARAAAAYAVAAVYAGKPLLAGAELSLLARRAWPRLAATYALACAAVIACLSSFLALLVTACSTLKFMLYPPDIVVCAGLLTVLAFSVAYAHTIIVCNLGGVIAVLEDIAGVSALRRSVQLMRGQTHVGLLIFLGSTIGLAFVEGLFEHRVKTLSYGDGSSRLWEGPLLVLMYSFVMLIDSMMSVVFYFTCRSSSMEILDDEGGSIEELEMMVGSNSVIR
ncbi:Os07g0595900, partial [Oryza sativa Japonica Group]